MENACKFAVEHVLHFMLIPGKVENWDIIIDLEGVSITKPPLVIKHNNKE